MKEYTVYFKVGSKGLQITVKANSEQEAIKAVYDKISIVKVESEDELFAKVEKQSNHLKEMSGLLDQLLEAVKKQP